MPVDREQRDAVAEALASFMRGEIDSVALHEKFEVIRSVLGEGANQDEYLSDLLQSQDLYWRGIPLAEDDWRHLCRQLAFLKSDLQYRQPILPDWDDEDRPCQILLARWHTLGLLAAFAVSYYTSWWILAIANVISFVLYLVSIMRRESHSNKSHRAELEKTVAFSPFASQDEWAAHEPLLEAFHLPCYSSSIFSREPSYDIVTRILRKVVLSLIITFCVFMFGYMYVCSMALWPLWLLLMSLGKRENPTGEDDRLQEDRLPNSNQT